MMVYTVRQLARIAGVSVRTLHYYDRIGLLKPASHSSSGYRQYGEEAVVPLQQIMFFRELGFSLDDIKDIVSRPDFDVLEALRSHRTLLKKKSERINELLVTVDRTISQLQGEVSMDIKDYYEGFSDDRIEEYRQEVRERWGEDTLRDSEARVMNMGKKRFAELQAEGGAIFQAVADNMPQGFDSPAVQQQVAKWRRWLEHFHTYSDEALLGLGRTYSQDSRFAGFFEKYGKDFPAFFTKAIEHYCANKAVEG
jgi:DNA-binding transcriptional MerR regulator